MTGITEKMNLFRRVCEQAAKVVERFGLGVVRSDDHLIVYVTSPHMGGCYNKALPPNSQHYFRISISESGIDQLSWWTQPAISNLGTIKLASLAGAEQHLSDFDPGAFAMVTERLINRINELECQLDAKDQSDAVASITDSHENLRSVITGTNPRLEETLYPCAGPEYT